MTDWGSGYTQGNYGGGSSMNIATGSQGMGPRDFLMPNQYSGQVEMGFQQGMAGIDNRAAPQLDPSQQAAFRAMQLQQAQQLQRVASGQQQGAGELAVQRQVANAQAAQQAQAMMARGGQNAGLAMRNAATQQAGIGLAGAGQSQQAALSDQQMAQGQLTGALGQGRQGDIGMAGQNANLLQQQYGMNDQARLGYLNNLSQMGTGELNAGASNFGSAQQTKGIAGSVLEAGGGLMAMMSDERVKTDVRDASNEIDNMLDRLVAKSYRYKDPKHGEGRRPGIMAQDLERSTAGSRLVREVPDGKAIDVNRALSAALASAARLNERLRKLEKAA